MTIHWSVMFRNLRNLKLHRKLSNNVRKVDEFTLTSSLPFQPVPRINFFDRISIFTPIFKDQIALVSAETKKSYTYVQLDQCIANFGTSLLKKLHLQSDDILAVALPNCPEYPVVVLGTLRAGCIVSPVNPAYKIFELAHQFRITKPKVVVTIIHACPVIIKALQEVNIDAKIVIIDNPTEPIPDGAIRYTEIAENGEADYSLLNKIEKDHDDLAIIPFSSGTTGLPKGVEITYKNLLASYDIMIHDSFRLTDISNGTYQDIVPCILPFFHIYGLVINLLAHLHVGAKLITMSTFDPVTYIGVLSREKVSALFVVPPLVDFVAKHPLVTRKHLEHLKYIFSGGAPITQAAVEAILLKAKPKTEFFQGYGLTETTCIGTMLPRNCDHRHYDSCGEPAMNIELRMYDPESGKPVPIGQPGEICVRSPVVTKGYYQNEQATKECMTSDGFYKSGDLGVYSPDKGLYVTGRIKELIKVKGMQVAPAEIENILRAHPSVKDVAVIGIPHEAYGEVPKAFIVTEKPITTQEIKDFVASQVADFKKIHEVIFVGAIPKNATGKILRRELKSM